MKKRSWKYLTTWNQACEYLYNQNMPSKVGLYYDYGADSDDTCNMMEEMGLQEDNHDHDSRFKILVI